MTNKLREALRSAREVLTLDYEVVRLIPPIDELTSERLTRLVECNAIALKHIDAALNESDDTAGGTYGLR